LGAQGRFFGDTAIREVYIYIETLIVPPEKHGASMQALALISPLPEGT